MNPCQVRFNQPPVSSVAPLAEPGIRVSLIGDLSHKMNNIAEAYNVNYIGHRGCRGREVLVSLRSIVDLTDEISCW